MARPKRPGEKRAKNPEEGARLFNEWYDSHFDATDPDWIGLIDAYFESGPRQEELIRRLVHSGVEIFKHDVGTRLEENGYGHYLRILTFTFVLGLLKSTTALDVLRIGGEAISLCEMVMRSSGRYDAAGVEVTDEDVEEQLEALKQKVQAERKGGPGG